MLEIIKKINNAMKVVEEFIVGYGTIALAVLIISNVVGRNVFGYSLFFVQEVNEFLIIIITFVGCSYAARNGRHIRMSALSDLVPEKYEKKMTYLMTGGTFVFLVWLTYVSGDYIHNLFQSGRTSNLLTIPLWRIWIIVPIGLGLTTIHYFMAFIRNLMEPEVWISFDEKSEYEDIEEVKNEVETDENNL